MAAIDPSLLAQALIRCPSVTPEDHGALAVLEAALVPLGFSCRRLRFEAENSPPVENLYARLGAGQPNFCFAGHTDVVPPGELSQWRHDPFKGEIAGGMLYGRGAADMKGAIAAFVAAVARHVAKGRRKGSISLLITGDEEGSAVNGTVKVLGWLKENGEILDHCLVGEPTSAACVGDAIKIGRRGSLNVRVTVRGIQGHVAYSDIALNPIPIMAALIALLSAWKLDEGTAHFQPSTLAFTTVDAGNPAVNVTPAEIRACFNIRFNDLHTAASLLAAIERMAAEVKAGFGGEIALTHSVSGGPFLTQPSAFTELLSESAYSVTGTPPVFSTSGGTSDARFIKDYCPVAELGLLGRTMHKSDECAGVEDIAMLSRIYESVLDRYFAQ